jgi:hypothetical protein
MLASEGPDSTWIRRNARLARLSLDFLTAVAESLDRHGYQSLSCWQQVELLRILSEQLERGGSK